MPIDILMPQLSPTMTEGNLAKWHKQEGDKVKAGDVLAEIETDKATMEVEAVDEGTMSRIVVPAGTEGVKVNTVIAVIQGDDEAPGAAPTPKLVAPTPAAVPAAAPPAVAPPPKPAQAASGRTAASPLARRMAERSGLALEGIVGSGPGGRIVKGDVEATLAQAPASHAPASHAPAAKSAPQPVASAPPPPPTAGSRDVPLSLMRKTIARRLQESKQTIPHFYLTIDCTIDALLALRKDLNGRSDAYKLTVNDFVVRAVGLALRQVPDANAMWAETAIRRFDAVDVAVAVALDGGLITPVVRDADRKGLAAISNEVKDLAARARAGKLAPEEYQGGGFAISNLGMYGIRQFAAIINPPQAGILAIGAGEQQPIVKDGALAIATQMSCTLSCDHRVIDGALGAQLLGAFRGLIEDPLTMLL
ncbi:MAG: pyruvate dehydrogenase complex dihydrolipoamide acetyltransferase [Alphaproteobacteria bacterium]|nr:pyruvate dehydrogenase complex dihydrolipoamide acetyltransferase [Alphaproteobacteria bacterium]